MSKLAVTGFGCLYLNFVCGGNHIINRYNFCLSNAMHGQNINLPVCICLSVCVCVYVTLSVNLPTGQTPQRIFTVDS